MSEPERNERPAERALPDEPDRKWVWMDKWDPATWQMPENPSPLTRVLAGVALVIIFVMTVYVPFRMLGIF